MKPKKTYPIDNTQYNNSRKEQKIGSVSPISISLFLIHGTTLTSSPPLPLRFQERPFVRCPVTVGDMVETDGDGR